MKIAGKRFADGLRRLWSVPESVRSNILRSTAAAGMAIVTGCALIDYYVKHDSSRMVMMFYTIVDGKDIIEERIVKNADGKEGRVRRFVDEVLLGPLTPGAAGFFPPGPAQSCVLEGDSVFISLPPGAVWAGVKNAEGVLAVDGGRAAGTLVRDLKRNFRFLKNVELFIDGREMFFAGQPGG
jgi:hypothetical protein